MFFFWLTLAVLNGFSLGITFAATQTLNGWAAISLGMNVGILYFGWGRKT